MVKQKRYSDEIDLATIIKIIWKRKKIVISGTLIITFISLVFFLFKNPKYSQTNSIYVDDIIGDVFLTGVDNVINKTDVNILKMLSKYEYEKNFSILNNLSKYEYEKNFSILNDMKEFNQQIKAASNFKNYSFNLTCNVFKHQSNDSREIIKVDALIFKSNGSNVEKLKKYNEIVSNYLSNKFLCLFFNKYKNLLKINYNRHKADLRKLLVNNHRVIARNKYFLSSIRFVKKSNSINYNHWIQVEREPVVIVGEDSDLNNFKDDSYAYIPIEQQLFGRKVIIKSKEQEIEKIKRELLEYSQVISLFEKDSKDVISIINNEYIKNINNEKIKINLLELLRLKEKFKKRLVFNKSSIKLISISLRKSLVLVFFLSLFAFIFYVFVLEWFNNNKKDIFNQ